MKIGVVLTGVAQGSKVGERKVDRNWKLTNENTKSHVLDSLKPHHDVKMYITTYNCETLLELINFYQPAKTVVLPWGNITQRGIYIKSMTALLDEDVDFIIAMRFDMHLNAPVNTWNIDPNKFNFIFREISPAWENQRFISDSFFAFPKRYLKSFIESIKAEEESPCRPEPDLHNMYLRITQGQGVPESEIHFIFEGTHNSGLNFDNMFFKVMRGS